MRPAFDFHFRRLQWLVAALLAAFPSQFPGRAAEPPASASTSEGAGTPERETQQTVPPRLLATGKNAKVYAWGVPSDLHDTLTKVLFR